MDKMCTATFTHITVNGKSYTEENFHDLHRFSIQTTKLFPTNFISDILSVNIYSTAQM